MRLINADEFESYLINRYGGNDTGDEIIEDLYNQPTVDAVVRERGEWIEENSRPKSMMFCCSVCHRTAYDPQNHRGGRKRCRYAYCPNCGADMRKEGKTNV